MRRWRPASGTGRGPLDGDASSFSKLTWLPQGRSGDSGEHAAGVAWIGALRHRGYFGGAERRWKKDSQYLTLGPCVAGIAQPKGINPHQPLPMGHVPSHPFVQADWSAPSTQPSQHSQIPTHFEPCLPLRNVAADLVSFLAKLFNQRLFFFPASLHLGSSHHDGR